MIRLYQRNDVRPSVVLLFPRVVEGAIRTSNGCPYFYPESSFGREDHEVTRAGGTDRTENLISLFYQVRTYKEFRHSAARGCRKEGIVCEIVSSIDSCAVLTEDGAVDLRLLSLVTDGERIAAERTWYTDHDSLLYRFVVPSGVSAPLGFSIIPHVMSTALS
jgi:hypothetical protein